MTFLTILTFKTIFGHYLAAASGVVSVLHRKYVAEINTMRNCLELICWLVTFSAYFDKLETLIRESTCCSIPSWSLLSWRPLLTLTHPRTSILDGQDHWKLIFIWFLNLNTNKILSLDVVHQNFAGIYIHNMWCCCGDTRYFVNVFDK